MPQIAENAGKGSISLLLARFLRGSNSAFNGLVDRCLARVATNARPRMSKHLAKVTDAEDLALAAFFTLWERRQRERKEPLHLDDRHDLLALLAEFTMQEMHHAERDHTRQKRDVRRTLRASDASGRDNDIPELDQFSGREPPPDWKLVVNETVAAWVGELRPRQQEIVRKRLEGYEQREIGLLLGCSLRAIEREISAIKSDWRKSGRTTGTRWYEI